MLNIIVLVKQVPSILNVRIDPVTNNLIREGIPSVVNPFDIYAIEEALKLREQNGGTITALSMGPPQALDALKYVLAMGADRAILLSDKAFAGSDTLATSYVLGAGIKKIGIPDLILCGKQASDGDTAQVPPEIAEHLDIACVTYVSEIISISNGKVLVRRTVDYGDVHVEAILPAMLTVHKGINKPRLPLLGNMVSVMNHPIKVWSANEVEVEEERISLTGSPTKVIKIFTPKIERGGRLLQGSLDEQIAETIKELGQLNL